ncbi:MAG: LysE family translocator [Tabrizicola sp.]|nr:LysE family translocator [Tabrizicola sp.]
MTFAAFLAAWGLHLIAAASPGPAVLMTARIGVTEGFRAGAILAIGIGFGAVFWAVAALFGLALLFQLAPALLWAFKIGGGLFLCWIAFQMWINATEPLSMAAGPHSIRSGGSALKLGILTQLANPKPAVFFGAVFVGTVPPDAGALPLTALLIAVFLNEALCNLLVARAFSFEGPRRAYAGLKTTIDRSFGGILALLGLKIAAT